VPRLLVLGTFLLIAQVSSPQCGSTTPDSGSSGGSGPAVPAAASNVLAIAVTGGPTNDSLNAAFATVTVCVPGTSNCQTIGNILIDTGSSGLRIVSSVLTLPLPQQTNASGASVVECLPFLDSVTWGPVVTADVRLAGEQASAIPVQVIGTDKFPLIPSGCSSQGSPEETVPDLDANGILGIGLGTVDCGSDCTVVGASNPGLYYACSAPGSCQITQQAVANQVVNPVARFLSDNNGTIIQLPAVPVGGQASVTGALIFGIGTQANNGLGSAKVLTTDAFGNMRTTFNGQSYGQSFIDSGSNGIFFLDTVTTGLQACRLSTGFYCPPAVRAVSATQIGANGVSSLVSFNAGSVDNLNAAFSVMSEATGSNPGGFDWGLPFFYGRAIYTAIAGRSTPGGPGPYWAY
jgi:Protein of unknown function (DUF3443)